MQEPIEEQSQIEAGDSPGPFLGLQRLARITGLLRGLSLFFFSAGLFIALEAAIFRTDLYPSYLAPESYAGQLYRLVKAARPGAGDLQGRTRVLVLGDSRIAEGFSAKLANERWSGKDVSFLSAGLPGSTPRVWAYLVREIDPLARRFDAVVIPTDGYDDRDGWENWNDRLLDARFLLPIVSYSNALELANSFESGANRQEALISSLFKGYGMKQDLLDLLSSPGQRLEKVRAANRSWAQSQYNYKGREESLEGLSVDWETRQVTLPDGISDSVANAIQTAVKDAPVPQRGNMARYRQRWLGEILDYYENSSTRIIAIRMPSSPIGRAPGSGGGDRGVLFEFARVGRLELVPDDTFASLESPGYFFDHIHLNRVGRFEFSHRLADEIGSRLTEQRRMAELKH